MRHSFNIYSIAANIGLLGGWTNCSFTKPNTIVNFVKKTGLKSIEIPIDYFFQNLWDDEAVEFFDFARRFDITVYPCIENFEETFLLKNIELLKKESFNSIRIKMPHLGKTFYGGNRYSSGHFSESMISFSDSLKRLDPILKDYEFKLAVENHQDLDAIDLIKLCEQSESGNVGVTWDVGNSLSTMRTPEGFLSLVGDWIINIHLKDYKLLWSKRGFALRRCILGEGVIDPKNIFPKIRHLPQLQNISMELAAHIDRECDYEAHGYKDAFSHSTIELREFAAWLEDRMEIGSDEKEGPPNVDEKFLEAEKNEALRSSQIFGALVCANN